MPAEISIMEFQRVLDAVAPTGLMVRGGFHPTAADQVPGNPATLVLVGNAGPAMWRAFAAATTPDARQGDPDPLDTWTRLMLDGVADGLGVVALYPFTTPYLPFQRWALGTGAVFPSPIGPLIDPEYGLWHAYRGALAFDGRLELPATPGRQRPCDTCADKPCLAACPADAFGGEGEGAGDGMEEGAAAGMSPFDVSACVAHVASAAGKACLEDGCLARRACPIGREHVYRPRQARFHMERFLKAQGARGVDA